MRQNIITIEDFYNNPDDVRQFALDQEFLVRGNYPGQRTLSYTDEGIKNRLEAILQPEAGEITYFPLGNEKDNYNGAYQYTTCHDKTWIHCDSGTTWAMVIYLTPNAPLSAGTGLYRHKETGLYEFTEDEKIMEKIWADCNDYTKWELCDVVANKYNRAVLYRGNMFHASQDYFGQDLESGRLFQTFFFSTEW